MEKQITFNVTDALMSPLGMAMLTGAGVEDATKAKAKHIHTTIDEVVKKGGVVEVALDTLVNELGLPGTTEEVEICKDHNIKSYATVLDHNGAIVDWVDNVEVTTEKATKNANAVFTIGDEDKRVGKTVKLDFYVVMYDNLTEITIAPEDFGGFFYVEADTLYRNQDGKDMAATLTFPRVKIQSGFTLSMAPTGDPSTFDFVMDAFPAYTYFDQTKKVVCDIAIVGGAEGTNETPAHNPDHDPKP